MRGSAFLIHLIRDTRQAFRLFLRQPLFFGGAILTLALGIGANGAVFSILHAVLLQPLPYDRPNDVVMVWAAYNTPTHWRSSTNGAVVLRWHDLVPDALQDVAAFKEPQKSGEPLDIVLPDRAERLRAAYVTPNFFDVLGVRPAHGRLFSAVDDARNEGDLVVLSHGLWQRDFGGDPGVIGRPVTLIAGRAVRGPKVFTVVAVLPAAFRFTYPLQTEIWVMQPWSGVRQDAASRAVTHEGAIARLKPGVTLAAAQARLAALNDQIHPPRPDTPPQFRVTTRLEPVFEWVVGATRPPLLLLGGVALLLLLITCATVANALFVRVTERQRELAVRAALGAERSRLLAQLLGEGVALSIAGAVAGTLLAILLQPALRVLVPPIVPRGDEIRVSLWILAFGMAAAGITTLGAALAPAWRGARFDLTATLKRASGAVSADRVTARWRQGLVALQAAIAAALLVSAVLLLTSFWRLGHVPLGFDGERVLTLEMRLFDMKYRQPGALAQFEADFLANVRAIPGVLEAGITTAVPFRGTDFMMRLNKTGDQAAYNANGRAVDPAYFNIMRIPLLRGRLLAAADTATSPQVAVISESFARLAFGSENPVGKQIDFDSATEIVGVVGDARYASMDKDPYPAIYRPSSQWETSLICLVARTAPNGGNLAPAIRQAVREIDPALPTMNLTTIDRIITDSIADRRFYTSATGVFAGLALFLTIVGLSLIVARGVVERRKELAIRAALGATPQRLVRLVMSQGLASVLAGTLVGLAAAFAASKFLTQFLFGVTPHEPLAYAVVAALIVTVAAIAAAVPALRARHSALSSVLRAE